MFYFKTLTTFWFGVIFTGEIQIKQDNFEIDSLDYAINSQELNGKSAAGYGTAVRLTAQGHCGWWFAYSYECISSNVRYE